MKIKHVPGIEEEFKEWCTESGSTKTTAGSYWDRLKDFPYFSLAEDKEDAIIGKLDRKVKTPEQLTAVRQFVEFLFDEYEEDQVEGDEEYLQFKKKRNSVKNNLEVPKRNQRGGKYEEIREIRRQYIHKEDFHYIMKQAEIERRRMWFVLYSTGARIGEIKRLSPEHLLPEYGSHGAIEIPGDLLGEKKSPNDRTVEFLSPYPLEVLSRAPTGSWEDEAGDTWDDVFYPERYAQLENYYIKKYGGEIGVGNRSPHSFRHTRITDLINDVVPTESGEVDLSSKDVQIRSGHVSGDTTDRYTETSFSQPPTCYERYVRSNEVDLSRFLDL